MKTADVLMIDRFRMGTDGTGITTLVGFYGCPLQCRYCINKHCHAVKPESSMTSENLYNLVKIDRLYFNATGGGLTFGGGEPLLKAHFIEEIMELGAKEWHTTIETSLNVPIENWIGLNDYVDEFIVDVKDMNHSIYKAYTGSDNDNVVNNLMELQQLGLANKVLIRLPIIQEFNDEKDICRSYQVLEDMGYTKFNKFKYQVL